MRTPWHFLPIVLPIVLHDVPHEMLDEMLDRVIAWLAQDHHIGRTHAPASWSRASFAMQ
jgi:hypothetical protein